MNKEIMAHGYEECFLKHNNIELNATANNRDLIILFFSAKVPVFFEHAFYHTG